MSSTPASVLNPQTSSTLHGTPLQLGPILPLLLALVFRLSTPCVDCCCPAASSVLVLSDSIGSHTLGTKTCQKGCLSLAHSLTHHRPSIVNQSSPRKSSNRRFCYSGRTPSAHIHYLRLSPVLSSCSSLHSLARSHHRRQSAFHRVGFSIACCQPFGQTPRRPVPPRRVFATPRAAPESFPLAFTHKNDCQPPLAAALLLICSPAAVEHKSKQRHDATATQRKGLLRRSPPTTRQY